MSIEEVVGYKPDPKRRVVGYRPLTGNPRNPDGSIQLRYTYADEWPGTTSKEKKE